MDKLGIREATIGASSFTPVVGSVPTRCRVPYTYHHVGSHALVPFFHCFDFAENGKYHLYSRSSSTHSKSQDSNTFAFIYQLLLGACHVCSQKQKVQTLNGILQIL